MTDLMNLQKQQNMEFKSNCNLIFIKDFNLIIFKNTRKLCNF